MVVTFPVYFMKGFLTAAGWPRRVGLLGRSMIDRRLVETLYGDLLRLGMTLGACEPALAIQLLADNFQDRNWVSQSADDLLQQLRATPGMVFGGPAVVIKSLIESSPDERPWQAMLTSRLTSRGSENLVPMRTLDNPEFLALLHWNFGAALLWGLGHPRAVVRALERARTEEASFLPEARAAGLELPPDFAPESPRRALEEARAFVNSFQTRVRPLRAVPPELASHPRILKYAARGAAAGRTPSAVGEAFYSTQLPAVRRVLSKYFEVMFRKVPQPKPPTMQADFSRILAGGVVSYLTGEDPAITPEHTNELPRAVIATLRQQVPELASNLMQQDRVLREVVVQTVRMRLILDRQYRAAEARAAGLEGRLLDLLQPHVDEFPEDPSPERYQALVNNLIAWAESPQFPERASDSSGRSARDTTTDFLPPSAVGEYALEKVTPQPAATGGGFHARYRGPDARYRDVFIYPVQPLGDQAAGETTPRAVQNEATILKATFSLQQEQGQVSNLRIRDEGETQARVGGELAAGYRLALSWSRRGGTEEQTYVHVYVCRGCFIKFRVTEPPGVVTADDVDGFVKALLRVLIPRD